MPKEGLIHCDRLSRAYRRVHWKTREARATWLPRVQKVIEMCVTLEWLSVARGVRRVATLNVVDVELEDMTVEWATHGLTSVVLHLYDENDGPGFADGPRMFDVAVGKPKDVVAMAHAERDGDGAASDALHGYPVCCRRAFARRLEHPQTRYARSAPCFVEWVRELTAGIERRLAHVASRHGHRHTVEWLRTMRAWPVTEPREGCFDTPVMRIEPVERS